MVNFQKTDTLYNEVFISYSRENEEFAHRIVDAIYGAGRARIWIDWKDIPHGADWWESIQAGIDSADNFLFILSPASVRSEVCRKEVVYAIESGKRIITIEYEKIIDDTDKRRIHPVISQHNWLPFKEDDNFNQGMRLLIEAIETDLKHVRFHTRLQTRAREWENSKRKASYLLSTGELAEAQNWLVRAGSDDKRPHATDLQQKYIEVSQRAENHRKAQNIKIAKRVQNYQRASIVLGISTIIFVIVAIIVGIVSVQAIQSVGESNTQIAEAAIKLLAVETESAERIIEADIAIAQAQNRAFGPMTRAAVEVEQINTQSAEQVALASTEIANAQNEAKTQVAEINIWQPILQEFNCDDGYCVEMVLVAPGCFHMGTDTGRFYHERPVHLQCIGQGFWIDRYEVTNEQFAALGGQAEFKGVWSEPLQPQAAITWNEALAFCRLRRGTLPTEAQWEYAARGRDSLNYPWGNEFKPKNLSYSENTSGLPSLVGSHPQGASWVGTLDMLGNVAEWTTTVSDPIFFDYPYISDDGRENLDDTIKARIVRGGSFLNEADELYAAARDESEADAQNSQIGFRCILPSTSP